MCATVQDWTFVKKKLATSPSVSVSQFSTTTRCHLKTIHHSRLNSLIRFKFFRMIWSWSPTSDSHGTKVANLSYPRTNQADSMLGDKIPLDSEEDWDDVLSAFQDSLYHNFCNLSILLLKNSNGVEVNVTEFGNCTRFALKASTLKKKLKIFPWFHFEKVRYRQTLNPDKGLTIEAVVAEINFFLKRGSYTLAEETFLANYYQTNGCPKFSNCLTEIINLFVNLKVCFLLMMPPQISLSSWSNYGWTQIRTRVTSKDLTRTNK
jgi:hypothetical protein